MGFFEAIYTTCIKKCFVFSGRASRSEFWWFKLFYAIITWLIGLVTFMILADHITPSSALTLPFLATIFQIVITIPFISVSTRRLHDRGMSGFWSIILLVPLLIQFLIFFPKANLDADLIGGIILIFSIAGLVLHIIFMFKGTDGSNKYGPDPLKSHVDAKVFS